MPCALAQASPSQGRIVGSDERHLGGMSRIPRIRHERPHVRAAPRDEDGGATPRRSAHQRRVPRIVTRASPPAGTSTPMRETLSPAATRSADTAASAGARTTTAMPIPQLKVRRHLGRGDVAGPRQPAEHGRRRERPEVEGDAEVVGQHARQVVGEAATGDMGECEQIVGLSENTQQALHIDARRLQECLGEAALRREGRWRVPGDPRRCHDAAHQRKAVGVKPG